MATAQNTLLKICLRIDPRTKRGQNFQDNSFSTVITGATNATPIVITSASHGLRSGDQVYIIGVGGNTAANNTVTNPNWYIKKLTDNTFELYSESTLTTGVAGNGAYTSGGTVVGALIGTVDGNFTRQRQVDIYNEARMLMLTENLILNGVESTKQLIHGAITADTNLAFSGGNATIPAGFIEEIKLNDPAGKTVAIINAKDISNVQGEDSINNKFVYKAGTQLKGLSSVIIADGTYKIWYHGITDFTLTDIIGGATVETIDADMIPKLILIAEAIALESGLVSPLELTKLLLAKKGKAA